MSKIPSTQEFPFTRSWHKTIFTLWYPGLTVTPKFSFTFMYLKQSNWGQSQLYIFAIKLHTWVIQNSWIKILQEWKNNCCDCSKEKLNCVRVVGKIHYQVNQSSIQSNVIYDVLCFLALIIYRRQRKEPWRI